jgi:hypothetical protein
MKSQREAEREEQQRIKNLVLNYDHLGDDSLDGTDMPESIVQPNLHKSSYAKGRLPRSRPDERTTQPSRALFASRTPR